MKHVRGWSRSWSACILLTLLVGAGVMTSCGRRGSPLDPQTSVTSAGAVLSAADTVPKPPKPPKPADVTAQFVDADPTPPDSTGISRWLLGNNGPKPLVMNWTVTGDSSWSAFPIQGSLTVAKRSTASLNIPIPVPPGTPAGSYPLLLTVQSNAGSASAAGSITVPADSLPVDSLRAR